MSTTTPTLGLVLYDSTTDQVVTFATFRAVWGGTATTSNFYKIDTAIGTIQTNITALQNTRGAITTSALYISANYYEASVASITSYVTGMTILLKLDTDSNGTVTLNINSLGTKSVMKVNSSGSLVNITGGELQANRYYLFTYDGTQWVWVDANSGDQIYINGGASGNVVTLNTDNSLLGTLTQSLLISSTTNSATSKTTPVNADKIPLVDSGAGDVLKSLSLLDFKYYINSFLSVATAGGTTTLTSSSETIIEFTGTSNQTVTLPVTSTLKQGKTFIIINNSTGTLTVNSSGSNLVKTVSPLGYLVLTCLLTSGTTAASWFSSLAPYSESGQYTPTLTNTTNISTSSVVSTYYSRSGNQVTVWGHLDADPTSTGACELRMTLPITSNFGSYSQAGGSASGFTGANNATPIWVASNQVSDVISFQWVTIATTNTNISFILSYVLI